MGKFELIYQDPPWFYNSRAYEKTKFSGGAEKNYTCPASRKEARLRNGWSADKADYSLLTNKELLEVARHIRSKADDNAIMYCWVTNPVVCTGFAREYILECGFTPRTSTFNWFKLNKGQDDLIYGPGYYTASSLELCWVATRGEGVGPPLRKMLPSVIAFEDEGVEGDELFSAERVLLLPRGKHSQKPLLHSVLDSMHPGRNKVELFGREAVPGWDVLGCGVTGNDILDDLMFYE